MAPSRESGPEPPIDLSADGRLTYRPILSVVEGFGASVFELRAPETPAASTTEVVLIDPVDFDQPVEVTDEDRAAAAPIDQAVAPVRSHFQSLTAREGEGVGAPPPAGGLPDLVDHRPYQSQVKDQGRRNTCVAHTSMALLEAMPRIPDDLSERYAHYKFMEFLGVPHDSDQGLMTTDAARFLARPDGLVSDEDAWQYVADHADIVSLVQAGSYAPPQRAVGDQTYGYATYKLIDGGDGTGESIRNPQYLEALLAAGFDIAVGAWVSWNEPENTSVMGLLTDPATGEPYRRAGHAMLIVGYDRPHQYLILKNSWSPAWGHAGYGYFGYDFARAGFKYGFTVSAAVPGP
jgi:C1A family cysteine protease